MKPALGSRPVTYKFRYVTFRFNKLFLLKNRITSIVICPIQDIALFIYCLGYIYYLALKFVTSLQGRLGTGMVN